MVAQALEQGHQVIALVRSRRKLNTGRPNLRATKSNLLDTRVSRIGPAWAERGAVYAGP